MSVCERIACTASRDVPKLTHERFVRCYQFDMQALLRSVVPQCAQQVGLTSQPHSGAALVSARTLFLYPLFPLTSHSLLLLRSPAKNNDSTSNQTTNTTLINIFHEILRMHLLQATLGLCSAHAEKIARGLASCPSPPSPGSNC